MHNKTLLGVFFACMLASCNLNSGNTAMPSASINVFEPQDKMVAGNPIWSPLSEELAFTVFDPWSGNNQIYIMNLKTSESRVFIDENGVESLDWSPDGKYIVYNKYREIWLSPVEANGVSEFLTTGQIAAWSPDGKQMAIFERSHSAELGSYNLKVLDLESRVEAIILTVEVGSLEIFDLSWSPDNTQLVFSLPPNEHRPEISGQQIYLFELKTGKLSVLSLAGENYYPRWSPNGQLLAYIHRDSNAAKSSIAITHADGSCNVAVPEIHNVGGLTWSPEGTSLVYTGAKGVYLLDLGSLFGESLATAGPKCP